MSLFMMLIYMFIVDKIMRSKFSASLAAINDDEEVAEAMGVNVKKIKIISFTIPAMMIGGDRLVLRPLLRHFLRYHLPAADLYVEGADGEHDRRTRADLR